MQSGIPDPLVSVPRQMQPPQSPAARVRDPPATRCECPNVYCAIDRGQREIVCASGAALSPSILRNSSRAIPTSDSSLSSNTAPSLMPPKKHLAAQSDPPELDKKT